MTAWLLRALCGLLTGILSASGQIPPPPGDAAFVGELSLSGALRPVTGMLPMALAAREAGIRTLFVPAESAPEATLAGGMDGCGGPRDGSHRIQRR